MAERGVTLERATLAVNQPDIVVDGKEPRSRKFVDHEPPPPVEVVTSWPADANGRLKMITCFQRESDH